MGVRDGMTMATRVTVDFTDGTTRRFQLTETAAGERLGALTVRFDGGFVVVHARDVETAFPGHLVSRVEVVA